jgi:8-oxo-dGTP diphosphatase
MKTPITTSRLKLRPARMGDAAALYCLFNNWNVIRWLGPPPWPYTMQDQIEFLGTVVPRQGEAPTYLVIEHEKRPVGALSWTPRNGERRPYLGYWIGEPYWNKGYMTEAVAGVLDGLFDDSETDAVTSGIFAGNSASLAVQRKLGFEVVGQSVVRSRPLGKDVIHSDTLLTRARHEALNK